jgi:hypothetical protein
MSVKSQKAAVERITKAQYYQLMGLGAAYKAQNAVCQAIEKAAYAITQELDHAGKPETSGHTTDWLFESRTLDEMLDLLKIKVRK